MCPGIWNSMLIRRLDSISPRISLTAALRRWVAPVQILLSGVWPPTIVPMERTGLVSFFTENHGLSMGSSPGQFGH